MIRMADRRLRRRLSSNAPRVMILVADLNGDHGGRWKHEVVDLLSVQGKRQDLLTRTVDADYGTKGNVTYQEGLNILRRYRYDVLVSGRVRPSGASAKVTVLANERGVVGEVMLQENQEDNTKVDGIKELNKFVEMALILSVEHQAVAKNEKTKSLKEFAMLAAQLENIQKQSTEQETLRIAEINQANIMRAQGDREQDPGKLERAREIFVRAYQEEWFENHSHKHAASIGHCWVFQSRMGGDFEQLRKGLQWYRTGAERSEQCEDYSHWIELSACVIGTCLECYQRSGDAQWIQEADTAQEGLIELAAQRLPASETREAYEVACYSRAISAGYHNDTEQFLFAVENLRDYGRFDFMVELSNVASTSAISTLLESVSSLDQQFRHWRRQSSSATKNDDPNEWALLQNRLATCYAQLGHRDDSISDFWNANKHFHKALEVWTEDQAPSNYALVMDNLGTMHFQHYQLTGDMHSLRSAVDAHENSLRHRNPCGGIRMWASTARNAAMPLCGLATAESSRDPVDHAIGLLEQVVEALSEQSDASMLYDLVLHLAIAYDTRYELEELETDRQTAIDLYRRTLSTIHPTRTGDRTRGLRERLKALEGHQ